MPTPAAAKDAEAKAAAQQKSSGAPRFTATGIGVVTCGITLVGGVLDALLLDGPHVLFGLCFLGACLFAAARVRASDLMAAPISAPLAFALTLLLTLPNDGGGLSGHVIALATGLATRAGWLYAGTLVAAGLAVLRYFALRAGRR
jgi:Rossmann-like domain